MEKSYKVINIENEYVEAERGKRDGNMPAKENMVCV